VRFGEDVVRLLRAPSLYLINFFLSIAITRRNRRFPGLLLKMQDCSVAL